MRIHSRAAFIIWKLIIIIAGVIALLAQSNILRGSVSPLMFHYFAPLLCIAIIIDSLIELIYTAQGGHEGRLALPGLKHSLMICSVLVVYFSAAILNLSINTYSGFENVPFLIFHYLMPILVVVDWLLFDPKGTAHMWAPFLYPLPAAIYLVVVELAVNVFSTNTAGIFLLSGAGTFPYPLFDTTLSGLSSVILLAVLCYVLMVAFGFVIAALDNLMKPRKAAVYGTSRRASHAHQS